jgi:hypothetical protein
MRKQDSGRGKTKAPVDGIGQSDGAAARIDIAACSVRELLAG